MSTTQPSANFLEPTSEIASIAQQSFARFTRGYERFLKGVINVAVQQIELAQGLMEGSMADLELLAKACTPAAFVQAELEIFRRRSEQAAQAARALSGGLQQVFAETLTISQADAQPKPDEPVKTPT